MAVSLQGISAGGVDVQALEGQPQRFQPQREVETLFSALPGSWLLTTDTASSHSIKRGMVPNKIKE